MCSLAGIDVKDAVVDEPFHWPRLMQSILPNPRKGELWPIMPAKKKHSHHRFGTKSASAHWFKVNLKSLINRGMYESKPETEISRYVQREGINVQEDCDSA
jgi:hypothetical protein